MRSRELTGFAALFGAATLCFAAASSLLRSVPLAGDYFFACHPQNAYISELIQRGVAPLWNSYARCGVPLLANLRDAILYPGSVVFRTLEIVPATQLFLIFHYWLAGFLAYLLGRDRGLRRRSSLLFALAVSFNGFFFYHSAYYNQFAGIAWLPGVLLFSLRLRQGRGSAVLLGLTLAMQFLTGNPFFVYVSTLISLLVAWKSGPWAGTRSGVLAIGIAGILSAVQWFPFAGQALRSSRSQGMTFADSTLFSLPPREWARMLLQPVWSWDPPDFLGDPTITAFYLGWGVLGLALFALLRGGKKEGWWAAFAGASLLSFGRYLPGYEVLWRVFPGFKYFRFPAQCFFIAAAGLAWGAALGLEKIRAKRVAAGIIAAVFAEFIIFAWRSPFGVANAEIFRVLPEPAATLQKAAVQRVGHSLKGYGLGSESLRSESDWLEARGALLPDLSSPYHIPSASGYSAADPLEMKALFQALSGTEAGEEARDRIAGVTYRLAFHPGAGTPPMAFRRSLPRFAVLAGPPEDVSQVQPLEAALQPQAETELKISFAFPPLARDAWLYRADTFDPGWQVYRNGRREVLSKGYGAFQTMAMPRTALGSGQRPPATERVVFVYRPKPFLIGLGVTAAGLTALAIASARRCARRLGSLQT